MKKEVVTIDKKKGIYQITTTDERWYTLEGTDKNTGLPAFAYVPSATWITSFVYKDIGFYKWLATKGWDEAEAIKTEAGDKGSKIHKAIEQMLDGVAIKMEDKFYSKLSEQDEELTPDEYMSLSAFKDWYDVTKPQILSKEITVISKKHNFAGTVDAIAKIGDDWYVLDWKTSQAVWPSMEAQLSAYKQALREREPLFLADTLPFDVDKVKLAILQVGYRRNKRGWKFTEVEDQFEDLFLPALHFWDKANKRKSPKQVELPLSLKLDIEAPKEKEAPVAKKAPKKPSQAKKTPQEAVLDNNITPKTDGTTKQRVTKPDTKKSGGSAK